MNEMRNYFRALQRGKKDREREKEMWIPTSTTNENDEAWKWLK